MDTAAKWLPIGLGALATLVFIVLAPPSFYWLDSAELTAAGVGLGSSHPSGFPLYMMAVKLASLLPVGEISFRVNLLSGLCGGVCIALVARLVIEAGRGGLAALSGAVIASLALGCSLLFARHAVVAEVYVPTAALFAATLLCFDRAVRDGRPRLGLMLAVLCGLGLGLHASFRLLVPIPVAVFMWQRLRRGSRWPLYAPLIVVFVSLALHLYLPVRSSTGRTAALDWGHPSTASALVDHVTAARIRTSFADEITSSVPEVVSVNVHSFSRAIFDGLGPAALLLAVLGLGWLASRRRGRYLGGALLIAIVFDFVYSFWINPMGLEDGQNGALLAVAACIAAGLGATWFLSRNQRAAPFVGAFVAVLVIIAPLWATAHALWPASRSNVSRIVTDSALDELPPRAIVLTHSDSSSAAAIYRTAVEGARPDVAVLVRQQLRDAKRTRAIAGLPDDAPVTVKRLIATGRPIAWEIGDDRLPVELGVSVSVPWVLLGPSDAAGSGVADIERSIVTARRLWTSGHGDLLTNRHLATVLTNLGRVAFGRGKIAMAGQLFDAALVAAPSFASALVNRGVVASQIGDLKRAIDFTERALEVEPNRITALINAARYHRATGNRATARRHIKRALAIEPANAKARAVLVGWD